jgi:hypothetical protein
MIRPQQEEIKMPKRKLFKIGSLGFFLALVLSLAVALSMASPAEAG